MEPNIAKFILMKCHSLRESFSQNHFAKSVTAKKIEELSHASSVQSLQCTVLSPNGVNLWKAYKTKISGYSCLHCTKNLRSGTKPQLMLPCRNSTCKRDFPIKDPLAIRGETWQGDTSRHQTSESRALNHSFQHPSPTRAWNPKFWALSNSTTCQLWRSSASKKKAIRRKFF